MGLLPVLRRLQRPRLLTLKNTVSPMVTGPELTFRPPVRDEDAAMLMSSLETATTGCERRPTTLVKSGHEAWDKLQS